MFVVVIFILKEARILMFVYITGFDGIPKGALIIALLIGIGT